MGPKLIYCSVPRVNMSLQGENGLFSRPLLSLSVLRNFNSEACIASPCLDKGESSALSA